MTRSEEFLPLKLCMYQHIPITVNVASNHLGVQPLTNVSRWSASLKATVTIPQPALITHYNHGMGGTDRMDQNLNCYQINIRNKMW